MTHSSQDLLKSERVTRDLPINYREGDAKLFYHEIEKEILGYSLIQASDIRINHSGHLFKGYRLLPESFHSIEIYRFSRRPKERIKIWLYNLFKKRRTQNGEFIWLINDWSKGYFHWVSECLVNYLTIPEEIRDRSSVLLPVVYEQHDFVLASLGYLGIKNVEFIQKNELTRYTKLHILALRAGMSGNFHPHAIDTLRKVILKKASPNTQNQRVYISRRKARFRTIQNEDDLINVLSKYSIRSVILEDMPWIEQVTMFNSANLVISIHGAGLVNMIFMPQDSAVLEIRNKNDDVNNCYFSLASVLKFKYAYVKGKGVGGDIHRDNLVIDPREIDQALSELIK